MMFMSSQEILQWVNSIGPLLCSWPTVVLLALIVFRKPLSKLIQELINENVKRAKVGPVEIERELGKLAEEGKQAVENMNQLNILMGKTRLFELEVTEGKFGPVFSPEQRAQMQQHINELRTLMQTIKEDEERKKKDSNGDNEVKNS
jgi:hypothetical protein